MKKIALYLFVLLSAFALHAKSTPTHLLTPVEKYDLQMLRWEGFAPLKTFHNEEDYQAILQTGRLADGSLWPIPILLTLDETERKQALEAGEILLIDEYLTVLARMKIESVYRPDAEAESMAVYNTTDQNHPFIQLIFSRKDKWYVSGSLSYENKMPLPEECISPSAVRHQLSQEKGSPVVGFQTRNPLHRSHFHLTLRALEQVGGGTLLLTPVIGPTQPGDVNTATRIKCYRALLDYYPKDTVKLCLIPLAMRMAGPKEALLHALIRKNYGCTHFIVGRDHAGPSMKKKDGSSFYGPYEAQQYLEPFEQELGLNIIKSEELVYVKEDQSYVPVSEVKPNQTPATISGTELRRLLAGGGEVPSWFSFPEVIDILQHDYQNRGTCIYLIGLSGAGKSTLARALIEPLEELTQRKVIQIDADIMRKRLFPELGFSPEARSSNVRRIGTLASLVVESGGICIVANCAPYEADRTFNRNLISEFGTYMEAYVNTPLDVCMSRDPKKIYEKYQKGEVREVLGIDLPFEVPQKPDFVVDGSEPLHEIVKKFVDRFTVLQGF